MFIQSGSHLLVSDNDGASFRRVGGVRRAGDCSYDGGPQALWALCSTGMAPDEILLSSDSGNTFTAAAQVPNGPIDSFAAASGTVAVASGQGPLYVTSNAGASWTPAVAPIGELDLPGLHRRDPRRGDRRVRQRQPAGHRLYYTTDGGASYHRVTIG